MDHLDELRLLDIECRLSRISSYPWSYSSKGVLNWWGHRIRCSNAGKQYGYDTDFIVHAPDDIEFLLDLVETLQMEALKKSTDIVNGVKC